MPPQAMALLKSPMAIAVLSQLFFTASDLLARGNMKAGGFTLANFCTWWFAAYMTIRQFATFGQLYVFANFELGKTSAVFGAISIALSNMLGLLLLGETLSPSAYLAVSLVITAFLIFAFS